ncbi:MAG: hypothetical protein VW712_13680 [Paracoccaceae bacterium]
MTKVKLIIFLTCTSMVFWALYSWNLQKPQLGQSIVAHVELRNTCEISDDYLVLYDTETGARARFRRGEARLSTQYGNILTIKLDRAAKGLSISAPNERAQQKVLMKLECDTSSRFDEIKKSLRDELN